MDTQDRSERLMAGRPPRLAGELFGLCALYAAVLVASIKILEAYPPDWSWRIPVAILPAVVAAAMPVVLIRHFRRVDELERKIQFESIAFAFVASAIITFTYGFLEGVGFPHLNWTWMWVVMAACWQVGRAIATRRYR